VPAHPKVFRAPEQDSQTEDVVIAALGFLAGDDERLSRFIALTGIDPSSIRQQINEPQFQLALIDHLFEDESLLLAFCAQIGMEPARLVQIHTRMKPHNHHGLREG
jgi:hypothetical protein